MEEQGDKKNILGKVIENRKKIYAVVGVAGSILIAGYIVKQNPEVDISFKNTECGAGFDHSNDINNGDSKYSFSMGCHDRQ